MRLSGWLFTDLRNQLTVLRRLRNPNPEGKQSAEWPRKGLLLHFSPKVLFFPNLQLIGSGAAHEEGNLYSSDVAICFRYSSHFNLTLTESSRVVLEQTSGPLSSIKLTQTEPLWFLCCLISWCFHPSGSLLTDPATHNSCITTWRRLFPLCLDSSLTGIPVHLSISPSLNSRSGYCVSISIFCWLSIRNTEYKTMKNWEVCKGNWCWGGSGLIWKSAKISKASRTQNFSRNLLKHRLWQNKNDEH